MTQDVEGQENPENQGENQEQGAQLSSEVTKQCIEITKWFRAGTLAKVSAILELQSTIPRDDESAYLKALSTYVHVLDNFECIRGRIEPGRIEGDEDVEPGAGERKDSPADSVATPYKRPRLQSVGSDDGTTKHRVDVSAFAWVIRDGINPPSLSPSLLQTQAALENFSRDLKLAKSSLFNSARLPQFPDSEWTNLITGRAVDLDHVLASQYSVAHDNRRTEHIGELELVIGSTKPARVVDTHGKWVIAWDQAVDATTFVFPHRTSELREYGRHISQLFASFPDSLHSRVIQYDRAV